MAEYAKRPEVTVSTMGKVHNPTGEGVRAVSSQVQAKAAKKAEAALSHAQTAAASSVPTTVVTANTNTDPLETRVKEGTAKRNIARKKTSEKDTGNYDSTHKKQGGHGKGQWKEVMDPSYVEEIPIDEKDPLYDEVQDSKLQYILSSNGGGTAAPSTTTSTDARAVYGPLLTLCEFKLQLADCLREYFNSSDADEVIRTLEELGCPDFHAELVKKAVSLAMDQGPRERELTSRLLTCVHPTPLSVKDLQTGFTILLDSMDDLSKDVPDASTMVASFLARAVVDEVLPPAFLSEQNNERPGDTVVEKAVALLSREHCNARMERVWGPGDGRPVEELKKDMDQLLEEYLLSRELDEAARCVKELNAPHFHHELVKRGVKHAMERDGEAVESDALSHLDVMAALFGFLVRNAIVSDNQVKKGVDRLHKTLSDLSLDVPAAPKLLETFEKMALEQGCLAADEEEKKKD